MKLATTACCVAALLAFAADAGVFVDDFEDGVANGWRPVRGDWAMRDGAYVLEQADGLAELQLAVLDSPWLITNAVISFTVSFEGDAIGTERPLVLFRLEDDDNGYAFRLRGDDKGMDIGLIEAALYTDIRGDPKDAIDIGKPSHIVIEADANIFFVTYNDAGFLRVGDLDKKYEAGRIGIGALNVDTPIHFEDIRVEGDGVTQFAPDLLSVDAHDRLTLAWATLKSARGPSRR
ncbi:hypothetical protein HN371_07815 [Candidatus Poribacteria bacterium]|jgi:hypothetical protein|nr:hypothetical protein [Candidatus Poribacteria bacterium]MBT5533101.1 hypothetical protein [Candidatus Poribacteria bacterium]MBT5711408.1 hypothetical protein [Candidatus Poribacteria bacterium]MBT7099171.1 hypothetical protein [Candidatus Poribacteria bacterium]MBT7807992.1 hypothetical protein [Candidatus Poribacteria bacterium]